MKGNNSPFRFATIAAVSSDEQVLDKKLKEGEKPSIPKQLEITRAAGERMGGQFINEYVIDGYPRTGYFDLTQAMEDIPPLRECLDDLHTYDVLFVKNYDRFGSLGMMIYNFFAPYRKQMYSVEQATPIVPPEEYNPYQHTGAALMIQMMGIPQIYRIAKITDAFRVGIPARVEKGLYGTKVPYGYIKIDKETVQIDPTVAALLVQFPEWYLQGASFKEIARRANGSGVLSRDGKKWTDSNVGYTLRNPFYAGMVFHGRGHHDQQTGTYILHDNVELYEAKHESIWTWELYQQVQAEIERRVHLRIKKSDYNFTGLIHCGECGATLVIRYGRHKSPWRYWRCNNNHVSIRTDKANLLVAAEMERIFSEDHPLPGKKNQPRNFADKELQAVRRNIKKLEDVYFNSDAYTPEEYTVKRKQFLDQEKKLLDDKRQKQKAARQDADRLRTYTTLRQIGPHWPEWIRDQDPRAVKFHLSRAVQLTAFSDKTIQVQLI